MRIEIERTSPRRPDVRELIHALDRELTGKYPSDQNHALSLDELEQENMRFFLAQLDGRLAGCGGVAFFEDYAEVKRIFTVPSARRAGVGSALMRHIETEAGRAGVGVLRLETGIYETDAIRMYERLGFAERAPFGPYAEKAAHTIEASLFFEKPLKNVQLLIQPKDFSD